MQDLTKVQRFLDTKDYFKRQKVFKPATKTHKQVRYQGANRNAAWAKGQGEKFGKFHSPYGVTQTVAEMFELARKQGFKGAASQLEGRLLSRSPIHKDYYRIRPDGTRWPTVKVVNPHRFKKGRIPWNKGKKGVQIPWNKGLKLKKNS